MSEATDKNNTPSPHQNSGGLEQPQKCDSPCTANDGQMPPLLRLMSGLSGEPDPKQDNRPDPTRTTPGYSQAIMVGEAGTCLAASRLLGWGFPTQPAMPGAPYDLSVDLPDGRHARVQVKTTARLIDGGYRWVMKRGFYRSNAGVFPYKAGDFDIAALVALPIDRVLFRISPFACVSASRLSMLADDLERQSWDAALGAFARAALALAGKAAFPRRRQTRRR